MEPSASAVLPQAPARDSDSSDDEHELTDAEYAQLLQDQLSLDEEESTESPPAVPAAQNDPQRQGFGFNRGMIVFNVGRCAKCPSRVPAQLVTNFVFTKVRFNVFVPKLIFWSRVDVL
jgi:hypothetical protein